jgi:hypothetical protein
MSSAFMRRLFRLTVFDVIYRVNSKAELTWKSLTISKLVIANQKRKTVEVSEKFRLELPLFKRTVPRLV